MVEDWYLKVYGVLNNSVEETFNVNKLFLLFNGNSNSMYEEYREELRKFDGLTEDELNGFLSEFELINSTKRRDLFGYLYNIMNRGKSLSLVNKINTIVKNKNDKDYTIIVDEIRKQRIGQAKKYIKQIINA